MCECVFVSIYAGVHVPQYSHGGQGTTFKSRSSPSALLKAGSLSCFSAVYTRLAGPWAFGGPVSPPPLPHRSAENTDAHNTHLVLAVVPGTGIQILGLMGQALIHWPIFLPHVLRKTKVVYESEQLALGVRKGRETGKWAVIRARDKLLTAAAQAGNSFPPGAETTVQINTCNWNWM